MQRNTLIASGLAATICGMVGLSFASVPLYRMFCAATGYGGTPQIGGPAGPGAEGGTIDVRFDANTSPTMPWKFTPGQRLMTVKLGEENLAHYVGLNEAGRAVTGVATYNVTPEKVGHYFHKTACFCFNEQTLASGQTMQFPLSFWVDPAIATDPATRDVHTITLSYTFFRSLDDAARNGGLEHAGPHVGPRADAAPSASPDLSRATISR
jgi:cytochrome c oxidase assembly protein subunit 11